MKSMKIQTGSRDRFRSIEEALLSAGYSYAPGALAPRDPTPTTPEGKLDLNRRGTGVHGLVLRQFLRKAVSGRERRVVKRIIPLDSQERFEKYPCLEIFSLVGILGEPHISVDLAKSGSDASDSLRYALCYGAGKQTPKKPQPASYKLTARECPESIDFYEIAQSLTRSNPIAVVHEGTGRGWVVVHRQFIRQAFFKGVHTLIGSSVLHGYKLKYGDAWAFEFDHPREISEWKKWAKEVKNTPWGSDQRNYEVDYIEV